MSDQTKKRYIACIDTSDIATITISLGEAETFDSSPRFTVLHEILADTWEEASAVHNIKMGWGPYKPAGEPDLCPNRCGSYFYPEGSGECPRCGRIC